MIKQHIILDNYQWEIDIYYAIHGYYVDEIVKNLVSIGIRGKKLLKAKELLEEGKVNTGLAYVKNGRAVCVIGKASSAAQYADSLQHEAMHLAIFIAQEEEIPLDSEEVCYIGGEIARKMHPKSKYLTSECGCYTYKIGKVL